jgi:hypothetical protein
MTVLNHTQYIRKSMGQYLASRALKIIIFLKFIDINISFFDNQVFGFKGILKLVSKGVEDEKTKEKRSQ